MHLHQNLQLDKGCTTKHDQVQSVHPLISKIAVVLQQLYWIKIH